MTVRLLLGALLMLAVSESATAAVPLVVSKSAATVWDPFDLFALPKAIPGAQVDYTISVTNPAAQGAVAKSVVVADMIPPGTKLYIGTLDTLTGSPVVFTAIITSNLAYSYTSLSNTADGLDFSKDNGSTWTYTPSADSSGCDAAVTNIRVKPSGNQGLAETFTVRFRVVVK